MRIYGQESEGFNTCHPRKKFGKKTKAEKKLAKRQASYDMLPIGQRKGRRRPGSLKKG